MTMVRRGMRIGSRSSIAEIRSDLEGYLKR